MFAHQNFKNSFSLGYTPTYREANVPQSYNFVQNGQIRDGWYGSMHLDEQNRTISGPPGFEHFKQSYSSAVRWARGLLPFFSLPVAAEVFNDPTKLISSGSLISSLF